MLKQRILTALILIPLVIAALFLLPLQQFALACAFVMAIGAWEWSALMGKERRRERGLFTLTVVILLGLMSQHFPVGELKDLIFSQWVRVGLWLGFFWWLIATALILTYPKSQTLWQGYTFTKVIFGLLVLLPCWLAIVMLRSANIEVAPQFGSYLVLYVLALVWSADIGAYFVGRRFGRRKLLPQVSPGKTKEGLVGGLFAAMLLSLAIGLYLNLDNATLVYLLVVSFLTALFSAVGDLTESMLKRDAGLKDSGHILPGHGGVLDRIDSITAAMPVFALAYLIYLL